MREIVYFTAEWCNPCKKTRPIVEELMQEDSSVKFNIVDVDDNIDMARDFQVSSIPTFIVVQDNEEIFRVTGAQTRAQLEALMYG